MGHILVCSPYGTEGEMKSVTRCVKMVESWWYIFGLFGESEDLQSDISVILTAHE